MTARTHQRAYTLLELLLVMTVLGIAAAMVVPSMGSTDALRIQAAVRHIVADINFAQSDALARQQGRAIVFDIAQNRYSLLEVNGPTLNPATDTLSTVNLGNKTKFHDAKLISALFDGDSTLIFDEMGGPVATPGGTVPSGGGKITLTGSGTEFTIIVEAYTGRVVVVKTQ